MSTQSAFDAQEIARLSIHQNERDIVIQEAQTQHRISLVQFWNISDGEKVLELGGGQGDTTTVLASAVGESGHVTAVDPGALDYGSPYTLGQAQSHISQGPVGKRVTFVKADPLSFLKSDTTIYDAAVLAHCIWYFPSPEVLKETLDLLQKRAKRICIAEYALTASQLSMIPHVLAALAHAALQSHIPDSTDNIRTALSPTAIKSMAEGLGLKLSKESSIVPPTGMLDGRWESEAVLRIAFSESVEDNVKNEREKAVIFAIRDAVKLNRDILAAKGVNTMDVWVAILA